MTTVLISLQIHMLGCVHSRGGHAAHEGNWHLDAEAERVRFEASNLPSTGPGARV